MTIENSEKVALITGANKGIGLETARQLGAQGITVLIGARDAERGETAAQSLRDEGLKAQSIVLDVTDQSTLTAARERIESEFGRLDILVNNAGIALDAVPPSQLEMKVMRDTYDTNVFGPVAAIQTFLPLLKQSPAGRIVNVSSGLGSLALNTDPSSPYKDHKLLAYNSSKTALNAITIQFAHELRDSAIKINAACPGYVATDLNNHSGPRSVQQGAQTPVRLALLAADGPNGGFFNDDGVVPW